MLSDHYRGGATERLLVSIVTVDPANGRVEAVGKDAAVIQVAVGPESAALFRWPEQGELWTIIRENGVWSLESLVPGPDSTPLASLNPGDALVQAEKIWTPSGDYLIRKSDQDVLSDQIDAIDGQINSLDSRLDVIETEVRHLSNGPSGSITTLSTSLISMTAGPSIVIPTTATWTIGFGGDIQQLGEGLTQGNLRFAVNGTPESRNLFVVGRNNFDGGSVYGSQSVALVAGQTITLVVSCNGTVSTIFLNGTLFAAKH